MSQIVSNVAYVDDSNSLFTIDYTEPLFHYMWNLKDGFNIDNDLKAFGLFVCGGGSTMGCKLAGFNHLGGVELMTRVADIYKLNHKPKYMFNMDIRHFNKMTDLPAELFSLDLLELSPPCTAFSNQGQRDKIWGKELIYNEGKTLQTLDDLILISADTINKLKPKTFIMENVLGLLHNTAIKYLHGFIDKVKSEYKTQVYVLNGARVGLPQNRSRVFVLGSHKDLRLPSLSLNYNHTDILFKDIINHDNTECGLTNEFYAEWLQRETLYKTKDYLGKFQSRRYVFSDRVLRTLQCGGGLNVLYDYPRYLDKLEFIKASSFPLDYNFNNLNDSVRISNMESYLMGMSVPPIMIANLAAQIKLQWLKRS